MGVIDDKKGIFTEIGALLSAKESRKLPDSNNSISSINNSKEPIPFMLDTLGVLSGSESLKKATGEMMTDFIRDNEDTLQQAVLENAKDQNSDQPLPNDFINDGYSLELEKIDTFGDLKTDPSSNIGDMTYGSTPNTLDKKIYEAIVADGAPVSAGAVELTYDNITDQIIVKPTNASATIGEFIDDFVSNLIIINEPVIIAQVMNLLFGTINKNQNQTIKQSIKTEKVYRTINKIISENENIIITDDELKDIENIAQQRVSGINNLDVGCSILQTELSVDNLNILVSTITGTTDPLTVGNAYVNALNSSYNNDIRGNNNDQAIRDGYFKRLINGIVTILVAAVTVSPQMRMLFAITSGFNSGSVILNDPVDDLNNRRKLANCLAKAVKKAINEFIFNLLKKELLKLIVPITKQILREKIIQYIGIIKSLARI